MSFLQHKKSIYVELLEVSVSLVNEHFLWRTRKEIFWFRHKKVHLLKIFYFLCILNRLFLLGTFFRWLFVLGTRVVRVTGFDPRGHVATGGRGRNFSLLLGARRIRVSLACGRSWVGDAVNKKNTVFGRAEINAHGFGRVENFFGAQYSIVKIYW